MTLRATALHSVLLGLGSNLGDRDAHLHRALELLEAEYGARVDGISPWFETEPVGGPPQGLFLNGAALICTPQSARELLVAIHDVEARLGRQRTVVNGPRPVDVDILLYDDAVIEEPDLCVPHPAMLERAFVLQPACEVAPERVHPLSGRTLAAHWRELRELPGSAGGEPE